MKVYILTEQERFEGETILGVYYSPVGAKGYTSCQDVEWISNRGYKSACVEYSKERAGMIYYIYEHELS